MQKTQKKIQPVSKKPVKSSLNKPSYSWMNLIVILSAFVLYANTFQHDFTLDDDLYFVKHTTVQKGVKGIPQLFMEGSMKGFEGNTTEPTYRPITLSTFALEKEMSGKNPNASSHTSHAINVFLYALLGMVVLYWLRKLFPDANPWIHFMILMLYMAHPVHTEVVASVKSRDELLAGLFGFLAMGLGMKMDAKFRLNSRWIITFFVFLLALMCKESAITLTLLVPLTFLILKKDTWKSAFVKSLPFFVAAATFLLIRQIVVQVAVGESKILIINNVLYGIHDFWDAIATKLEIILVYLRLLVYPHPLSWDYSFNQVPILSLSSPLVWLSVAIHAALIFFAFKWLRKKPVLSFAIVFYFVSFSLTNNLVYEVRATVAERFMLIPSMGFIIALVYLACELLKIDIVSFPKDKSKGMKYGFYTLFAVYSIMTILRNPVWKDNFTLFQSGLESAPNSARVLGGVGFEYMRKAEASTNPAERSDYFSKAFSYYEKSLDILPSYNYSSYNLGVGYYESGDTAKSIAAFKLTIQYSPNYHNALMNLGLLYMLQNQLDSGILYLSKLRDYYPGDIDASANIAIAYVRKQEWPMALKYAEEAIQFDPQKGNNYQTKANILHNMGNEEEALKFLKMAQDLSAPR